MASEDITGREADPYAAKLQPEVVRTTDPSELPGPTLVGFYSPGPEAGLARLHLPGAAYIQFKTEEVVACADVPPDQSPVLGERATLVRLQRDARVDYVRDHVTDEFQINVHLYQVPAVDLSLFGGDEKARYGTASYTSYNH